ncbi:helix-turn-helix domain-containing protein [Alicyclobacillus sendaiensis]|uniref:AraC family transcriptional regulator n=1 Tax=Alicyclobacillus sendaiensis PA2 TaxID=3029425 RepID=A0ABT6XYQ6_ALISE|nr:helix-turn-helix domain-containing protein [Alicyclobacillus sendaiensis]MDI9260217.1 AraC family transcriptional regulator [Alicyclobacillus sendaiensis PA2]
MDGYQNVSDLASALGLEWWIIDAEGRIVNGSIAPTGHSALSAAIKELATLVCGRKDGMACPAVVLFRYFERFVVVQEKEQFVVLGPGAAHHITQSEVERAVQDGLHATLSQDSFIEYATALPSMSHERWMAAARLLARITSQHPEHSNQHVSIVWLSPGECNDLQPGDTMHEPWPDESWFETHGYQFTPRHDPDIEQQLFKFIREGDEEGLVSFRQQLRDRRDGIGTLAKRSEIRNRKNLGICSITLATRIAVSEGVDIETAYSMSDAYIQLLEECTSVTEVEKTMDRALASFARAVHTIHRASYSRPVRQALSFMRKHVASPIRIADVAAHVGVHPRHLSQRFKQETGQTLYQALSALRMARAIELLTNTQMSIGDIASALQFADQSHFTRRFRQFMGLTPLQFRLQGISGLHAYQPTDVGERLLRGE